jgi:hypothetical protein
MKKPRRPLTPKSLIQVAKKRPAPPSGSRRWMHGSIPRSSPSRQAEEKEKRAEERRPTREAKLAAGREERRRNPKSPIDEAAISTHRCKADTAHQSVEVRK